MGASTRIFWLVLSAVLLGLGLTLLIISFTAAANSNDRPPLLCMAAACLVYFVSTFRIGCSPSRPGAWMMARRFLIDACIVSAVSAAGFLIFVDLRGEEIGIAVAFLIFSLVFALFLGLLPKRFSGARRSVPEVPSPGPDGSGWSALGAVLVTLGISVTLGSALLASGLGEPVIQGLGREGAVLLSFIRSGMHFLVGCALFLPGLFSILRGRQAYGAAHVFRGALGFSGTGALVWILARTLPEISADPAGKLRFTQVWAGDLIGLFSLGVLTALLLFWPAKPLPSSVPSVVEWRSEVRS